MLSKYYFLLFLICSVTGAAQDSFRQGLVSKLSQGKMSGIVVGMSVFEDGREVFSYNSKKNFMPASVLKLFYTLPAIEEKGEDYKFRTEFFHTGSILYDGTLEGDIVIYASGDPTLGSKRFYKKGYKEVLKAIGKAIKRKNISCIDGDIILVTSYTSYPVSGSWTYEDIGNYYGGGFYPLNFNDNEYELSFETGNKAGEPTKITGINPEIYGLRIRNFVKTGKAGSGDNAYIYSSPYEMDVEVKGTLPPGKSGFTIRGAIPNPPETFMYLLGDYFDQENIYYRDLRITDEIPDDKTFIFAINSPPLIDIVKMCNDYSINMYSEALAHLLCNTDVHPEDYMGEDELYNFFKKYDFYKYNPQIVDGCGLSSSNLLSPFIINDFVAEMSGKLGLEKVLDILPQAGKDGYAKSLFDNHSGIWLKSGSISGVLNYSGIVKTGKGKYLIFSIMGNNIKKKDTKYVRKRFLEIIGFLKKYGTI